MKTVPDVDKIYEVRKQPNSPERWAYDADGNLLGEVVLRFDDYTFEEMQEAGYDFFDGFGDELWIKWESDGHQNSEVL